MSVMIHLNNKESRESRIKKWKSTGLLDELDEPKLGDCAESLEITAQLLIEDYDRNRYNEAEDKESVKNDIDRLYNKDADMFAGIALPIVRRIYGENVKAPDPKWLYEDLKSFLTSKHKLFKDMEESSIACDTEAGMCELYVKDLVARLS